MQIEMYVIEEKNINKPIEAMSVEDKRRNGVDTIAQFYVLQYLKKELNLDVFDVYLIDATTIMVRDRFNVESYFRYDQESKKIINFQKK